MLGHCDFFEQVSGDTEGGRLTPDMIVRLPGDRRVVVDAKAPRMYQEGLADGTDAERSRYFRDHAAKVRAHMTLLAGKRYWEQFAPTPEFVVMFLPVEALFAAALQEDPGLLEYGADKKVIPASPLTLIALLRAVNYGWKQESLAHDASKIRELGKELYNSVRVLAGHLAKMRNNLEDTVQAFNASVGSVERSFLSKARRLAVSAKCARLRDSSSIFGIRRASDSSVSGRNRCIRSMASTIDVDICCITRTFSSVSASEMARSTYSAIGMSPPIALSNSAVRNIDRASGSGILPSAWPRVAAASSSSATFA
jgi:hypothetical protein